MNTAAELSSDSHSQAAGATVAEASVASDAADGAGAAGVPVPRAWFLRRVPFGVFLIVTAAIGLLMSFELSIDKLRKLEDPGVTLSCDLNPFFSCGDVMGYPQAQLLGFPNQFLGIAAFVVPLLLGVLVLAGVRLPGWIWVGLSTGLAAGAALCMYLFYASIFAIGVGCPWCIVVWSVTIPMFCVVTGYTVLRGHLGQAAVGNPYVRVFAGHALLISILWMVIVYALIIVQFWTYFSSLV